MHTALQINLVLPNIPSSLAKACDALRAANVNINAISCTEGTTQSMVHIVVDDTETAKLVLQPLGQVMTHEILCFTVKNKPGALASLGRACGFCGVSIRNIYSTTCGKEATVYVDVDDLPKALEFFKGWHNGGKLVS